MAVVFAVTIGIAGAVSTGSGGGFSFAGGGSVSFNNIANTSLAEIESGDINSSGNLKVSAVDNSQITADGGGVAVVFSSGPPNGLAIGVSLAINDIQNTTSAYISSGATVSSANAEVSASSTSTIDALTIAGGGSVSTGQESGIVAAGAGAISVNTISNNINAKILGPNR
jgi:hypothetical protein